MPLLLLVSMYEFRQFLNIVLWIAVPATLVAVLVTVFLHYRRRKNLPAPEVALEEAGWQTLAATSTENLPDWLASTNPDNTTLLKKYEREVRRYRENYASLEQEFRELEEKYTDLRNKAYTTNKEEDATLVKQLQQELKAYKEKVNKLQHAVIADEGIDQEAAPSLQATIQQLQDDLHAQQEEKEQHAAEIVKLERLLKSMEQSVNQAREESAQLQQYYAQQVEEMGKGAAGDQVQGLQQLLTQAEVEKKALKEKLYEQEYLPDVLEEKKLQIEFLQTQLEQRIKNHHILEQQSTQSTARLQEVQTTITGFEGQVSRLNGELQAMQQQAAAWHTALEQSREEAQQQQEVIRSKTGHIEQLEGKVQDMQQQQSVLQSEIADQQDTVRLLQERLADEQQKAASLGDRLEQSHQLFNRIYADLAHSLGKDLINGEAGLIINTAEAELQI